MNVINIRYYYKYIAQHFLYAFSFTISNAINKKMPTARSDPKLHSTTSITTFCIISMHLIINCGVVKQLVSAIFVLFSNKTKTIGETLNFGDQKNDL